MEEKEKGKDTDLFVGKSIGLLHVLSRTSLRDGAYPIYKCQCECGRIAYVSSRGFAQKGVRDCGCKLSPLQARVKRLLEENNLFYTQKVTFQGLVGPTGWPYRFDFYVRKPNGQWFLIECGHAQTKGRASTRIAESDEAKEKFCAAHAISLKRIPSGAFDSLTIEKILGDDYLVRMKFWKEKEKEKEKI
jgi:hypothetical protein